MKNLQALFLFLFLFLFSAIKAQSPLCNADVSICTPGIAGPFSFESGSWRNGAGFDYAIGSCLTGEISFFRPGDDFTFIQLNITSNGVLNMLLDANTNNGFLDVIVFKIPPGTPPCVAIMNPANEIGCNYADFDAGCVQFGTDFPCSSSVPAPNVQAGDQLMIIVHDFSGNNSNFNLELGSSPGSAGTGAPNATISGPSVVNEVDPSFPFSTVNAGGEWTSSCGTCINSTTGVFNPAIAGPGVYDIFYQVGTAPCIAYDTTQITVTPDCIIPFNSVVVDAYEGCKNGEYSIDLNFTDTDDYIVYFNILGTATNGVDYSLIIDSLIVPANTTSASISIEPIDDAIIEGTETIILEFYNPCDNSVYFTDTIKIIEPGDFNVSASKDTICPSEQVQLLALLENVEPTEVDYSWTPNNGTITDANIGNTTATPGVSSTYTATYTLGTCSESVTLDIIVDSLSIVLNPSQISCPGADDGVLEVIPSGGLGDLTYSWTPNLSDSSKIVDLSANTYTVSVSDESGNTCGTATASYTLSEPAGLGFSYDSSHVTCFGNNDGVITINGLQSNSSYTLTVTYEGTTLPIQNVNADVNGVIIQDNLLPGVYDSIVITNTITNCSGVFSVLIEEPDTFAVQITVPGNILCAGGTIDSLTASTSGGNAGTILYEWSTGETTKSIQNIVFGTYWVETEDINGCLASDTVVISQPIPLFLEISADSAICGGQNSGTAYVDSVSGGVAPYTYQWTGNTVGNVAGNDTAFNLFADTYTLTVTDFNGCSIQETVTVLEPTTVLITFNATDLSCFGDTDGSVDATISGGSPNYTFSWDTGDNTEYITNQNAGWKVLTVTDGNNCVYTDSVEITEANALVLSISSTDITCKDLNNGTATVVVSGGTPNYTYLWNGGNTPNTATTNGLSIGVYQVIVTDANACVDSISTASLTEPDSLLLITNSISNVSCNNGNDGAIQISTQGGTPNYTYLWSNVGGNNEDLSGASAGTYTLTVTDANNCSFQKTETITEAPALSISLVPTNVVCFGQNSGSINANVSGGTVAGSYTFAWTGPNNYSASSQNITGLAVGIYTLTITDDNNCSLSESVTITEPVPVEVDFTKSSVSCFGGNDGALTVNINNGGTAPFTYQWDAAANNQTSATAIGLIEGSYEVTITDANTCTYSFVSSITQPNTPLSLALSAVDITCAGYNNGELEVIASGGTPAYTYLWNDSQNQTTANLSNLAAGTYQVTVTDSKNCSETDSITIIEPNAIGVDSIITDSVNCWGDATGGITIYANGGATLAYLYSIDGGKTFQNDPNFYNLVSGNYNNIVIKDLGSAEACLSPLFSATVFEPAYFTVNVNPADTTLQLEHSVTLELLIDAPYTINDVAQISWFPTTGLNCSDCVNPTVLTYEGYTQYNASVQYYGNDNELCNANTSTIIIVENNLQLFIPNAFTPDGFDETNNVFEVYGEGIETLLLQVYNRWGEKIFESNSQSHGWDGTYQGSLQNPGVYTYYVSIEYLDGKKIDRKGSVTLIR